MLNSVRLSRTAGSSVKLGLLPPAPLRARLVDFYGAASSVQHETLLACPASRMELLDLSSSDAPLARAAEATAASSAVG